MLHLTPGFNRLCKDNCKTQWETFEFWNLVRLILDSTVITIQLHVHQGMKFCVTMKRKCNFDDIFATGWTESYQNDNFQCSKWRKFLENDYISASVFWFTAVIVCCGRVLRTITWDYRKISNIRHTKSQNLNVSRLGLQLSLCNILKPSVKWRMKM